MVRQQGYFCCVSTAYPAVDEELLEKAVSWSLFLMHEVEQMAGIWNITQYVQHCNTVKRDSNFKPSVHIGTTGTGKQ